MQNCFPSQRVVSKSVVAFGKMFVSQLKTDALSALSFGVLVTITVTSYCSGGVSHGSLSRTFRMPRESPHYTFLSWSLAVKHSTEQSRHREVLVICSVPSECCLSQIRTPVLRFNILKKAHISLDSFYLRIFNPKGKIFNLKELCRPRGKPKYALANGLFVVVVGIEFYYRIWP